MANNAPPRGWEMETGTWGTDADVSTSVLLTRSASLHFKNTAVATKMLSDWIPLGGNLSFLSATKGNTPYVVLRADNNTQTNVVRVVFYDNDRTSIGNIQLLNGPVATADVWEWYGTPNIGAAKWARYEIEKAASAYNLYIDTVDTPVIAPGARLNRPTGTATIPGGSTWTVVNFNSANDVYTCDTTTGASALITLSVPGPYIVTAKCVVNSGPASEDVSFRFRAQPSGGAAATFGYAANQAPTFTGYGYAARDAEQTVVYIAKSQDDVWIEAKNDHPSASAVINTTSFFSVCRLGGLV